MTIAVIIATKGRPKAVSNILETLAQQTVLPDLVVVSASDPSDIKQNAGHELNVETIFAPLGLTTQRNHALCLVQGKYDIVVFFDDDFIPSRFWIERIQILLAKYPDVGCVTGRVLTDGVKSGGLEWWVGNTIVKELDCSAPTSTTIDPVITDNVSPYGCNMAFRAAAIENLWFDERLTLYGWLEDRDYGFRVATRGKTVSTDAVWGVHLGSTRGRVSGLRFGYSQVVNPWYLMTKGVLKRSELCRHIVFGLVVNTLGMLLKNSHVDRYGRLRGNIIGIKDIILNRWAPERIIEF